MIDKDKDCINDVLIPEYNDYIHAKEIININLYNIVHKLNQFNQTLQEKQNQIEFLQKDLQNTNNNLNQTKYLLSFQIKHGTAKQRIQNHLSYKLTLIINSNIYNINHNNL